MAKLWVYAMKFGDILGCHQISERSFSIRGYQFPVCARCTGVMIGYLTLIFCLPNIWLCGLGCGVMLLDWGIQYLEIKKSNNVRRFFTGICGGIGWLGLFIHTVSLIGRYIQ